MGNNNLNTETHNKEVEKETNVNEIVKNKAVENDSISNGDSGNKSRFSIETLIVPVIIAIIILAGIAFIFYSKKILPGKNIDKQNGYKVEDYISVDKYTGFEYEITQDKFNECVYEETDSNEEVERAAKDGDIIDFNYTAYIDGKKQDDISQENAELTVGSEEIEVFKLFSDAIKGKKENAKTEIKVDGEKVNEISDSEANYTGKMVTFKIKINSVSVHVRDEITDDWVKEYYFEDMGLETKEDFFEWCKEYLDDEAKVDVWQKALEGVVMSSYPQELYEDIVVEFTQNANYYADEFGLTTEEYLKDFCGYTDESLEEEYLNEVKSELLMWYIVKKQGFEATAEEIETKYEEMAEEMGYSTVDEMKSEYTKEDITEVILLDEVQDYVYKNSKISYTYDINKLETK